MSAVFDKPFTQQLPLPEIAIQVAQQLLQSGRLHRYNTLPDEIAAVSLLEKEYADYQGAEYCVAVTSGGQAIQIALRAAGVQYGDRVLANAYTLAPVPGAMYGVGAVPVFIEIGEDWRINTHDLAIKAADSGAKFLLLSHMRGHIGDMDAIVAICQQHDITLIEDCAHTMGARWSGKLSGNFGKVGTFSLQTYKHLNAGEGGFITTNDALIAAKVMIMSGSYMLYDRHGCVPPPEIMAQVRQTMPNLSARLDNLRAAIVRPQLAEINQAIAAWNARYAALEKALCNHPLLKIPPIPDAEFHVGSSIQFQFQGDSQSMPDFVTACARRGVELKWFGAAEPAGFTSRYDSWCYFADIPHLPQTTAVLEKTLDMRIPLTFSLNDCQQIALIISDVADQF